MKTLTKNKLLTVLLTALMTFCAVLGIAVSVPRSASADEAVVSEEFNLSDYEKTKFKNGNTVAGKYIYILSGRISSIGIDNADLFLFLSDGRGGEIDFYLNAGTISTHSGIAELFGVTVIDKGTIESDDQSYVIVKFEEVWGDVAGEVSYADYKLTSYRGDPAAVIGVYELTPISEAEPDEPTDENKVGVGEWFENLGNTVADWLGEHTGLSITGSSVLIVGALIIVILIVSKKR